MEEIDLLFLHNEHEGMGIQEKNDVFMDLILSKEGNIEEMCYILKYVIEHHETIHISLVFSAKIVSGGDLEQPIRLINYKEDDDIKELSELCDKIMKIVEK